MTRRIFPRINLENDEEISGVGEEIAHAHRATNIQNSTIIKTEDDEQMWHTAEEATAMATGHATCARNIPTTKTENDGTRCNAAKAYPFMNHAFMTYDGRAVFQHNRVLLEQPMRHIGEENCAISHFPTVPIFNQCINRMHVQPEPMLYGIASHPCGVVPYGFEVFLRRKH
ncbi:hypothetical protein M514_09601 [Trichuris suis]|uniref:Uncharacterized protein n=1 Tax=Trichuris suis TaxID=68888 RepID=A0A085N868_9BILA|nr:hypothetical protein M513_09601 [Trichuris suis]KFD65664.1 hypothetical protein M514_09601 [Trichuris suis]